MSLTDLVCIPVGTKAGGDISGTVNEAGTVGEGLTIG